MDEIFVSKIRWSFSSQGFQESLFKGENPSLSILGDSSQCQGELHILPSNKEHSRSVSKEDAEPSIRRNSDYRPMNLLVREVGPVNPDPCLSFWMASEKWDLFPVSCLPSIFSCTLYSVANYNSFPCVILQFIALLRGKCQVILKHM